MAGTAPAQSPGMTNSELQRLNLYRDKFSASQTSLLNTNTIIPERATAPESNPEEEDRRYRRTAKEARGRPYQYSAPSVDDMQQSLENEDGSQEENDFREEANLRAQEEAEESQGKLTLARNAVKQARESAEDKLIEQGMEEVRTMTTKAILNVTGDVAAASDVGNFGKMVETAGLSVFVVQVAYTFLQGLVPEELQMILKKGGIEPLSLSKALDVGISWAGIALVIKWFAVAVIIIAILILIITLIQNDYANQCYHGSTPGVSGGMFIGIKTAACLYFSQ